MRLTHCFLLSPRLLQHTVLKLKALCVTVSRENWFFLADEEKPFAVLKSHFLNLESCRRKCRYRWQEQGS